ncbi:MAG: DUF4349 domain-containing protein [Gammaproteobacteria bacterium]|nr:DUF4349 domain-containing protein [Gammaproteobacteria bacterium]MDH5729577.1 DUF4349 domain-containing protein [Gammaproteobacteria bacterium]
MKKNLHHFSFLLLLFIQSIAHGQTAINNELNIKPGNVDDAGEKLAHKASMLDGYFTTRSNTGITLKVPATKTTDMQQFVEENWRVYQQIYSVKDIGIEILQARSKLTAKEELLDEYQRILNESKSSSIIKVSTAQSKLVGEIEELRGRLNLLNHQIKYAQFTINFTIDRPGIENMRSRSSFPWLNEIGLDRLLGDME